MKSEIEGNQLMEKIFLKWCRGVMPEKLARKHNISTLMVYEIVTTIMLRKLFKMGWKEHYAFRANS